MILYDDDLNDDEDKQDHNEKVADAAEAESEAEEDVDNGDNDDSGVSWVCLLIFTWKKIQLYSTADIEIGRSSSCCSSTCRSSNRAGESLLV